jgi:asparagine synthase (glutamine-hydrolysing)
VAGDCRTEEDCAERLRELLVDATRLRLRSDVPVGAYLSGGIDSTVTTALIRRFTDTPLKTFSVTFEDPEYDESRYQQEAVRHLGTEHQGVPAPCEEIGREFPRVVWHAEKPMIRTAPVPLYILSGLVRRSGYKVVLTGEGSDEILGGYDIFKEAKIRRFWGRQPGSRWRPLLLKRLYPWMQNLQAQSGAYLQAFFHVGAEDLGNPFFSHLPRWELTSRIKMFFSPEVKEALRSYDALVEFEQSLPEGYAGWDPLCQAQYLETTCLLPGYILSTQGDRVAMGHSVEGRYPFLDHRVVEFAASLPPRFKMKGLNEKYILKKAAADLIPDSIRERPKQPYRAPDAKSFFDPERGAARFEYVREMLSRRRLEESGLFHPPAVEKFVDKAAKGQAVGVRDNMALVGILSTQLVMQQFIHHFRGTGTDGYPE